MANDWNPWFAWMMDLVKFAITFGVTAVISVFVINRYQEAREAERKIDEAVFQLEMEASREFARAARRYEVAALSAYTDLYQWSGGQKTGAMQTYELAAYGDFKAALDSLRLRFADDPDLMTSVTEIETLHQRRHALYDTLVDKQLDTEQDLDLWPEAAKTRTAFMTLLEEAQQLRTRLARQIDADIRSGG